MKCQSLLSWVKPRKQISKCRLLIAVCCFHDKRRAQLLTIINRDDPWEHYGKIYIRAITKQKQRWLACNIVNIVGNDIIDSVLFVCFKRNNLVMTR